MATETLVANGDGDDAFRVGIGELELHANLGGSYPESERRDPPKHLARYAAGLSIRSQFPPLARWRKRL